MVSRILVLVAVLAAAGSSADAARLMLGQDDTPAGKPLGYVPKGCTISDTKVEAYYTYKYGLFGPRVIRGTVTLSNGEAYDVPVSEVQVTLAPAVPVSPFILTAKCSGSSVPASPQPYSYGKLVCSFESPNLPTSGPAEGFKGWKTAAARVTIGMSGATCQSSVVPIKGWIWTDILRSASPPSSSPSGRIGGSKASSPSASQPSSSFIAGGTAPLTSTSSQSKGSGGSGRLLSEGLGYVPPSNDCLGLQITATAQLSGSGLVSGTVFVANPQEYPVPLAVVRVQINNNIPVAPIFVDAQCQDGLTVPSDPRPFRLGTLACNFSAQIPSNGIASDPSAWVGVMPKVTIAMSNAQCSGSVTSIVQASPGPLLYGH